MTRTPLTHDAVERTIHAPADTVYAIVSDVTRLPELSPEIRSGTWVRGATGPAVGARFRAVNTLGGIKTWPNWPVVVAADPGREFAISRTEPLYGTLEWRFRMTPQDGSTHVVESYTVTTPLSRFADWQLSLVSGPGGRAADLRAGMETTLERLAAIAETEHASASPP